MSPRAAAMRLSKYAARVTLGARGGSLDASMSSYLIREIEAAENVEVRLETRVVGGGGKGRLEHLGLVALYLLRQPARVCGTAPIRTNRAAARTVSDAPARTSGTGR